jgi:hypothetical protein
MNIITESAIVQRIQRKLRYTTQQLFRVRGKRQQEELGRYQLKDIYRNLCVLHHVNLEAYGRQLGVLRQDETVGMNP